MSRRQALVPAIVFSRTADGGGEARAATDLAPSGLIEVRGVVDVERMKVVEAAVTHSTTETER